MATQYKLIGICISVLHKDNRFPLIQALNREAVKQGFRLLIFNTCTDLFENDNLNDDGERNVFRLIPYEKLSAMIVCPHFLSNDAMIDEIVQKSREHGLPVISLDKEIPGCTCFTFSYANTFEQICRHVIDHHHAKNLLMMAGMRGNPFSETRVKAFRKVLAAHGMYFDDSLIGYGQFWEEPALAVMREWFEEEGRDFPDAIICANDSMAIAVCTYLQKHGCRVPEDCIVTGFDGIMEAHCYLPRLTTCRQDYEAMGKKLTESITALLAGETVPKKQIIGFRMIRSQSCGCEPVSRFDLNDSVAEIFAHLHQAQQRQDMIYTVPACAAKANAPEELPELLCDQFKFQTAVFAMHPDLFESPDFGAQYKKEQAFGSQMQIAFQRYYWYQDAPCTIDTEKLIPRLDIMSSHDEPIIICALHHSDRSLGYCVFQPELDAAEYEKMHMLMYALNTSFSAYHARMQIESLKQIPDAAERRG